jgi:ribosomal protein S18 acetylase RimI-like enzyme
MTSRRFDDDLLSQIEDAGLNATAPPQQLWMDGWLLRLSPGKAKRARCINAVAPGRLPLADKLARAAGAFRQAGLPMVVRITPFSQPAGLDAALGDLGLQRFDDTLVLAADLAAMDLTATLPAEARFEPVAGNDFAAIVGGLRESPPEQQRAHAERLSASPVPYRGWVLRRDGEVLACGQFAREAGFVGLYDVFTAPAARNQGLSRALCAALLRLAAAEGAHTAYLQVDSDNTPALAVYRRLGFGPGYGYHYRAIDPGLA